MAGLFRRLTAMFVFYLVVGSDSKEYFIHTVDDITIWRGEVANLSCETNAPIDSVYWTFQALSSNAPKPVITNFLGTLNYGQDYNNGVVNMTSENNLIIHETRITDAGTYTCTIAASDGWISETSTCLTVNEFVVSTYQFIPECDGTFKEVCVLQFPSGTYRNLTCQVTDYPPNTNLMWMENNTLIPAAHYTSQLNDDNKGFECIATKITILVENWIRTLVCSVRGKAFDNVHNMTVVIIPIISFTLLSSKHLIISALLSMSYAVCVSIAALVIVIRKRQYYHRGSKKIEDADLKSDPGSKKIEDDDLKSDSGYQLSELHPRITDGFLDTVSNSSQIHTESQIIDSLV